MFSSLRRSVLMLLAITLLLPMLIFAPGSVTKAQAQSFTCLVADGGPIRVGRDPLGDMQAQAGGSMLPFDIAFDGTVVWVASGGSVCGDIEYFGGLGATVVAQAEAYRCVQATGDVFGFFVDPDLMPGYTGLIGIPTSVGDYLSYHVSNVAPIGVEFDPYVAGENVCGGHAQPEHEHHRNVSWWWEQVDEEDDGGGATSPTTIENDDGEPVSNEWEPFDMDNDGILECFDDDVLAALDAMATSTPWNLPTDWETVANYCIVALGGTPVSTDPYGDIAALVPGVDPTAASVNAWILEEFATYFDPNDGGQYFSNDKLRLLEGCTAVAPKPPGTSGPLFNVDWTSQGDGQFADSLRNFRTMYGYVKNSGAYPASTVDDFATALVSTGSTVEAWRWSITQQGFGPETGQGYNYWRTQIEAAAVNGAWNGHNMVVSDFPRLLDAAQYAVSGWYPTNQLDGPSWSASLPGPVPATYLDGLFAHISELVSHCGTWWNVANEFENQLAPYGPFFDYPNEIEPNADRDIRWVEELAFRSQPSFLNDPSSLAELTAIDFAPCANYTTRTDIDPLNHDDLQEVYTDLVDWTSVLTPRAQTLHQTRLETNGVDVWNSDALIEQTQELQMAWWSLGRATESLAEALSQPDSWPQANGGGAITPTEAADRLEAAVVDPTQQASIDQAAVYLATKTIPNGLELGQSATSVVIEPPEGSVEQHDPTPGSEWDPETPSELLDLCNLHDALETVSNTPAVVVETAHCQTLLDASGVNVPPTLTTVQIASEGPVLRYDATEVGDILAGISGLGDEYFDLANMALEHLIVDLYRRAESGALQADEAAVVAELVDYLSSLDLQAPLFDVLTADYLLADLQMASTPILAIPAAINQLCGLLLVSDYACASRDSVAPDIGPHPGIAVDAWNLPHTTLLAAPGNDGLNPQAVPGVGLLAPPSRGGRELTLGQTYQRASNDKLAPATTTDKAVAIVIPTDLRDALEALEQQPYARFRADLEADGYQVVELVLDGTESPPYVRAWLQDLWNNPAGNPLNGAILIGDVPDPYYKRTLPFINEALGHGDDKPPVGYLYYENLDGQFEVLDGYPEPWTFTPSDSNVEAEIWVSVLPALSSLEATVAHLERYLDRNHDYRRDLDDGVPDHGQQPGLIYADMVTNAINSAHFDGARLKLTGQAPLPWLTDRSWGQLSSRGNVTITVANQLGDPVNYPDTEQALGPLLGSGNYDVLITNAHGNRAGIYDSATGDGYGGRYLQETDVNVTFWLTISCATAKGVDENEVFTFGEVAIYSEKSSVLAYAGATANTPNEIGGNDEGRGEVTIGNALASGESIGDAYLAHRSLGTGWNARRAVARSGYDVDHVLLGDGTISLR